MGASAEVVIVLLRDSFGVNEKDVPRKWEVGRTAYQR